MIELSDSERAFSEPAIKLADTSVPVHDLIRKRWSPRSFEDRPVSDEDLKSLLEAARWAASSNNEQPWRFFVARRTDRAEFEKLLGLLVPGNQAWANKAPVLMIMAARKTFARNGSPNRYGLHDAGQAFAQLALQAVALGLHVHGMAGFDRERAVIELNVPEDYEMGAALAVGYAGSPDQLPEKYREIEVSRRQRKPLDEIVFGAGWETPPPLK
jgi:nitroreductase